MLANLLRAMSSAIWYSRRSPAASSSHRTVSNFGGSSIIVRFVLVSICCFIRRRQIDCISRCTRFAPMLPSSIPPSPRAISRALA
ncbi:hypothetical protein IWW55_001833 [Coemansia sp. RSA 2706]|nr:hypothetical protein IWW55_001833 [Coemansia sp. RSA 2706]